MPIEAFKARVKIVREEATIKKDLGRLLLKLEELQDNRIEDLTTPKELAPAMSEEDYAAMLQLIEDGEAVHKVSLAGADLTGADLTGANVAGANFNDADVNSAKLLSLQGRESAIDFQKARNLEHAFRD